MVGRVCRRPRQPRLPDRLAGLFHRIPRRLGGDAALGRVDVPRHAAELDLRGDRDDVPQQDRGHRPVRERGVAPLLHAGRSRGHVRLLVRLVDGAVHLRHRGREPDPDAVVLPFDLDRLGRFGAPDPGPLHRHRGDPARLGRQHARGQAHDVDGLYHRRAADGAAYRVHRRPLLHRGLVVEQHEAHHHRTLGRVAARAGVALRHGLVGVRRGDLRDLRARVQGPGAGYQPRAEDLGSVLARRIPAPPTGRHGDDRLPGAGRQPDRVLRRRVREDRRKRRLRSDGRVALREPDLVDEHGDRRRLPRAVRDRQGRDDDQATPLPQQASHPVARDDA